LRVAMQEQQGRPGAADGRSDPYFTGADILQLKAGHQVIVLRMGSHGVVQL
jgi:hypothetical protein